MATYNQYYDGPAQTPAQYQYPTETPAQYTAPASQSMTSFMPMAIIWNQAKCMLIGFVVFAILLYIISLIPLVGPWVRDGVLWLLTKLMEFTGVAKCGYQNDFDDILEAES